MRKASKKQNRRLKRTVRRTIGALCLISAITIAAIPVPENMAYDPETTTENDYLYNKIIQYVLIMQILCII